MADIAHNLPIHGGDIPLKLFHLQVISTLHTPTVSRIPELLAERRPFATIIQAIITRHKTNPEMPDLLADGAIAETLRVMIETTEAEVADDVEDARRNPHDADAIQRVADGIAKGLADIRGVVARTNRRSVLLQEAQDMVYCTWRV